jgi:membrane-associated phospholipid phosphatase
MSDLGSVSVLTLRSRAKRAVSVGGAATLVVLIGFSRAYLGAHYFSNVAGGFAAGAHG